MRKTTYPPNQIRIAEIHRIAYEQAYALIEERFIAHQRKIIEILTDELKNAQSQIQLLTETNATILRKNRK